MEAEDWRQELPADACAMQHTWQYGATISAMARQVARARIVDNGHTIGLAQVVLRRVGRFATIGLITRGPIWIEPVSAQTKRVALNRLRRDLEGYGARILLATPEMQTPGLLPLYTASHLADLSLEPGVSQLNKGLHGKWRNALRKGEASGLQVVATRDPDVLVALIEKETRQQKHKRYRNLPAQFIANWVRLNPQSFRIYRALMGADPVAEMLFLDHAPGVTYQIGWISPAGRTFAAHNLLMWRAIADFAQLGRKRMDLGHLDTVNLSGLARFKLGTGATLRVLGATGAVMPSWAGRNSPQLAGKISTGTAL